MSNEKLLEARAWDGLAVFKGLVSAPALAARRSVRGMSDSSVLLVFYLAAHHAPASSAMDGISTHTPSSVCQASWEGQDLL